MVEDLGALTLLGESADWLKDAKGSSIRDRRIAALESYRVAWDDPADEEANKALRASMERLIEALRDNRLYPEGVILEAPDRTARFLAKGKSLRTDFEALRDFCVVNKFGIGEIHSLYIIYLLNRMVHKAEQVPYDEVIDQALGDILLLRVPMYRADNLAPFSSEVKARYHAIRLLRSMDKLGLFNDAPMEKLSPQDEAEATELLTSELLSMASKYVPRPHKPAFQVFDTASALDRYSRAHAASRAPVDDRSPEELYARLRHRVKNLQDYPGIGEARRTRLLNLGVASMVRAIAHTDIELSRKMYSLLRSGKSIPRVRHSRMFKLLPNNAERLRLLNFLYTQGQQNPVYYAEKFQRYFGREKLRFARKEVGFTLERSSSL